MFALWQLGTHMPPIKKARSLDAKPPAGAHTRDWGEHSTAGVRAKRVNGFTFLVYHHEDGFECPAPGWCRRPGTHQNLYHCC